MKKYFLPLLAGFALLTPLSAIAAAFEGTITSQMTNLQPAENDPVLPLVHTSIKESRQRMDMTIVPNPEKPDEKIETTTIIDLPKMEMYNLMPQQKMYMVFKIPTEDDLKTKPETATPEYTVEKTGKTQKILGYKCEQMIFTMKDFSSEVWGTDELGTYMSASAAQATSKKLNKNQASAQAAQAWQKALSGKNFFPLLTITSKKDKKGTFAPFMRMEVTSVEKKKLDDSLFVPPSDYKQFEMPDVKSMMKNLIPGFGK
jgi:hypothetical protein